MKAAVVSRLGATPSFEDHPDPSGPGLLVQVVAAGLHPRVRSQAASTHYTSTGELPLVPGIDGVGRDPDGNLRYFVLPDTSLGSKAERTLIDPRRSVLLPAGADAVAVAAALNPAMSSWVALRRRITFAPGADVLVLGATGNAGRMALEVARRLGAGRVVGAARRPSEGMLSLDGLQAAADVDIVLDYLWGDPTAAAMASLVTSRQESDRPLTWVQIGSAAGLVSPIPSAALRAARLQIVGSGQGSVPTRDIVAELPALVDEVLGGAFTIDADVVPLKDVARAWGQPGSRRIVLVP